MKKAWIIAWLFIVTVNRLLADNAPVTTASAVGNAVAGQHVFVPVTVQNFIGIGSFTLTVGYQTSVLTYVSSSADAAFTGLTVNTSTPGKIVVSWTGAAGVTLPDQTQLISFMFTYISGTSPISWDTTGTYCQYKKYAGGSYVVLSDFPKKSYYIDGVAGSHLAPKTYAPVITNATPSSTVSLPITVKNFTGIGSLYLMFTYDVSNLTYQNSFTANPAFAANFLVGSQPGPTGKRFLIISWYGNAVSLADGSTLVTLKFTYNSTTGNGNTSLLSWYECGPCCEYTDAASNVLYDTPTGDYYLDGMVTSQVSPVTWLPQVSNAVPGNIVQVPVLVDNFTNISAVSLAFKYDPAVLTLPSGAFTPNPIFGGALLVNNYPAGSDGKRTIVIGWNGSAKTLSNGSSIVTFSFQYNSGTTQLKWNSSGDSCEYADALYNPLWKTPVSQYFLDGYITSHVAPTTTAESTAGLTGQPLTIPVSVTNFNNIGSFSLTLDYDPGVIQFLSGALFPSLGGTFTASSPGPGQVIIQWTGPSATLPDGSILVALSFTYLGGSTPLQWLTISCFYKEGSTMMSLYDLPKTSYYLSNPVVAGKACSLSLLLEGLYAGSGTMNKAQDEAGDHFPGNTADEISVELHRSTDYSTIDYRTAKTALSISGQALFAVPTTYTGQWYVTVRHRNSIETTTALPVSFSGPTFSYTFDAPGKAYGSNMAVMIDGAAVIFSGDENQDGIVDGSDLADIENLATLASSGYVPQDLNGDGLVDGSDLSMAENDATLAVGVMTP
jgi:hypothetical protein